MGAADLLASHLCKVEGIDCVSVHDSERPLGMERLRSMEVGLLEAKCRNFLRYYGLCQAQATGGSLKNKANSLRAFLSYFGFRIPKIDQVLDLIDSGTLIEAYTTDFVQVYRSPDFYGVSDHSILRLEVSEWFELFERSANVLDRQIGLVSRVFEGEFTDPLLAPLPPHVVKEINSPKPKASESNSILYAPLYSSEGAVSGILHAFTVGTVRSLQFESV